MMTGLGKTVTMAGYRRTARVLILSHRDELVHQPARYYDCPVGFERAGEKSDGQDVVSASVQTLCRPSRLHEFEPGEFDVIFTDESHHALAPTHQRTYDCLRPTKVAGTCLTSAWPSFGISDPDGVLDERGMVPAIG